MFVWSGPSFVLVHFIRAVTRDFQQCGILTNVDSDEHVMPPFKLRSSNDVRLVV